MIKKPELRQQLPTIRENRRGWETVPPRSQKKPIEKTTGSAPITDASMDDRRLMLRRGGSVPPRNKSDEDVAVAVNRVLFRQQALPHIRIMNANRNAKGAISLSPTRIQTRDSTAV